MGLNRTFFLGILAGIFLSACMASFPYKYYTLKADSYEGSLLGPEPKDDLPLSVCIPTAENKAPCITTLRSEFMRVKADYLDMVDQLKACQRAQSDGL